MITYNLSSQDSNTMSKYQEGDICSLLNAPDSINMKTSPFVKINT